jgi:hypothetical protein
VSTGAKRLALAAAPLQRKLERLCDVGRCLLDRAAWPIASGICAQTNPSSPGVSTALYVTVHSWPATRAAAVVHASRYGQVLEVVEIARTAGGLFHGSHVRKSAKAQRDVVERESQGHTIDLGVDVVGVDAGDPLHDVQRSEVGVQPEVPPSARTSTPVARSGNSSDARSRCPAGTALISASAAAKRVRFSRAPLGTTSRFIVGR